MNRLWSNRLNHLSGLLNELAAIQYSTMKMQQDALSLLSSIKLQRTQLTEHQLKHQFDNKTIFSTIDPELAHDVTDLEQKLQPTIIPPISSNSNRSSSIVSESVSLTTSFDSNPISRRSSESTRS